MAQVVVMPQLGNTVESCLITTWLVEVGDVVEPTTLLCEIETDKSAMEVPAGVSGTVLALLAETGDDVPVKQPLAVVGEPGEDIDEFLGGPDQADSTPDRTAEALAPRPEPTGHAATETGRDERPVGVSPRARGLAAAHGVAAELLSGTGPHGRVIERDVRAAIAGGPGLTPGARAEASGFVPGAVGTGIGGRVTRADLAAATEPADEQPASPETTGPFPGQFTDTPLKGVRKVIADRMMTSLASSAQLSYTATAPAAGLLTMRARLKSAADPALAAVTIGDLVGYATVRTLLRHPGLNAHLDDNTLRSFASVHLGIAVDTPRGLLVPTLRFADTLTLREFSVRTKALAAEATAGSIAPDLLGGATCTVSNLGALGVESFTPLLNVPQVAILGVAAIVPRPVTEPDGSTGVEQRIGFSLTADHRVIDGADAARFLKDLCAAVADIDLTALG